MGAVVAEPTALRRAPRGFGDLHEVAEHSWKRRQRCGHFAGRYPITFGSTTASSSGTCMVPMHACRVSCQRTRCPSFLH